MNPFPNHFFSLWSADLGKSVNFKKVSLSLFPESLKHKKWSEVMDMYRVYSQHVVLAPPFSPLVSSEEILKIFRSLAFVTREIAKLAI